MKMLPYLHLVNLKFLKTIERDLLKGPISEKWRHLQQLNADSR